MTWQSRAAISTSYPSTSFTLLRRYIIKCDDDMEKKNHDNDGSHGINKTILDRKLAWQAQREIMLLTKLRFLSPGSGNLVSLYFPKFIAILIEASSCSSHIINFYATLGFMSNGNTFILYQRNISPL